MLFLVHKVFSQFNYYFYYIDIYNINFLFFAVKEVKNPLMHYFLQVDIVKWTCQPSARIHQCKLFFQHLHSVLYLHSVIDTQQRQIVLMTLHWPFQYDYIYNYD